MAEIIKRNKGEEFIDFNVRVLARVSELELETGKKVTFHKLGGNTGLGVKGASRFVLNSWK